MGRASSAKKVARAARTGGSRRPGQRRSLGFPAIVITIVVLGTALVLYARDQRLASAAPLAGIDHWHAAYGVATCGEFQDPLSGIGEDPLGIHTHEDGLIHIEPLVDGAAGRNAKLRLFADYVGVTLADGTATFPDGTSWDGRTSECGGEPAQIVVARWIDGQDAADGEKPNEVITEGFENIRFRNDREAYMIVLVPEAELDNIPIRPGIVEELNGASEAPPSSVTTIAPSTTSTTNGATTTSTPTSAPAPPG